jgi:protein disulfide-isomerase A6
MAGVGAKGRGTRSTEVEVEGDVTVLTVGNFEREVMMSDDLWLVEFYAPWCGHCKTLAPEWEKAATELKGKVKFAKVDATVEKPLAEKYEVKGFPAIKVFAPFDKEKVIEYQGGRTAPDIIETALELHSDLSILPSVTEITDIASFRKECHDLAGNCLLAFLDTKEDPVYSSLGILKLKFKKGKRPKFLWAQIGNSDEVDELFGIKDSSTTTVVGIDADSNEFVHHKDALDTESLLKFSKAISKKVKNAYVVPQHTEL